MTGSKKCATALLMAVSGCTGARRFYRAYMQYLHRHPGFDLSEPVEDLRPIPPAPTLDVVAPSIRKIYNGTAGHPPSAINPFFPVVGLRMPIDQATVKTIDDVRLAFNLRGLELDITDPNNPGATGCSGTLIAKHWIATAAHCIVPRSRFIVTDPGNPANNVPPTGILEAFGYYGYTIDWGDNSGNVLYHLGSDDSSSIVRVGVLQIPDPDWVGLDPTQGYNDGPSHDFALVYVPSQWDGTLPPIAAASSWAISLVDVDPTSNLTAWGWGSSNPDPNGGAMPPVLRSTPIQPHTVTSNGDFFTVMAPSAGTIYGTTCPGDSGGPWVRNVISADTGLPQTVIMGTSSEVQSANHVCAIVLGETTLVTSMSHEVDFINTEMRKWNGPNFECFPKVSMESQNNGNGKPDYAECFGSPCQKDGDCSSGSSCDNPSQAPYAVPDCTVCDFLSGNVNSGIGDCSCIAGQCLLNK